MLQQLDARATRRLASQSRSPSGGDGASVATPRRRCCSASSRTITSRTRTRRTPTIPTSPMRARLSSGARWRPWRATAHPIGIDDLIAAVGGARPAEEPRDGDVRRWLPVVPRRRAADPARGRHAGDVLHRHVVHFRTPAVLVGADRAAARPGAPADHPARRSRSPTRAGSRSDVDNPQDQRPAHRPWSRTPTTSTSTGSSTSSALRSTSSGTGRSRRATPTA